MKSEPERCLNCSAVLDGPFCSQCGQAKSDRMVPLKAWISNFSKAIIDLDSKLLKSLKSLMLEPGKPTVDFAEGRRIPFSGPVRTYIIVSAISIAAMTIRGTFTGENAAAIPGTPADPEIQKRIQFLFPFVNLLSPFLTAAALAVLQPGQYFQKHLAFSLHLWTVFIAFSTPLIFIPPTTVWALLAFLVLVIYMTTYSYLAHRRVYRVTFAERLFCVGAVLFTIPLATIAFSVILVVLATIIP